MPVRKASRKPRAAGRSAASVSRAEATRMRILDPIITMNAAGMIQSASDSVEQVFGWTPAELYGRNVKELIPQPRRSALEQYLDRYRHTDRTKSPSRMRRFDAMRKDGTVFPIELSVSRAELPAHAPPYFIGIIRDVTHNIDVGADSVDDRSRLHEVISQQTRALATANLRLHLADRLASLGTLAAGLGHDMNNVLLPVRARLNALEHAGLSDAARTHVTAVRRSIGYLQHLSDGLHFLAVDPNAPDTADDRNASTILAEWWHQVGALLKKAIPKHVTLSVSFPSTLPPVQIAPHWLTQAMLNLIVNAGEAVVDRPRGAIVRISARTADDGRVVRVSVTDNGRGMSAGVRRRAFDLFFTTKARGMGTGLGLPLAQKVAVRAGGSIALESQPGKGTSAVLVLPAVTGGTRRRESRPDNGTSAAVSVRDHRTAALITQILIGAGVHIRPVAADGPATADLWVTEPTSRALLEAMQTRKAHSKRVIVLIGAPARSTAKRWAALSAVVIDPPDDFEALRETLGHATNRMAPSTPRKDAVK